MFLEVFSDISHSSAREGFTRTSSELHVQFKRGVHKKFRGVIKSRVSIRCNSSQELTHFGQVFFFFFLPFFRPPVWRTDFVVPLTLLPAKVKPDFISHPSPCPIVRSHFTVKCKDSLWERLLPFSSLRLVVTFCGVSLPRFEFTFVAPPCFPYPNPQSTRAQVYDWRINVDVLHNL